MYYIYHIPTFKWKNGQIGKIGVSTHPKKRVTGQKYTDWEILETHNDIYEVSDREIQLQKEYGYPIDTVPYWKSAQTLKKHRRPDLGGKGNSPEQMRKIQKLRKHNGHPPTTPIFVYDYKTNKFIREYPSIAECGRDMNLDRGTISKVCNHIHKQYKGYIFVYKIYV